MSPARPRSAPAVHRANSETGGRRIVDTIRSSADAQKAKADPTGSGALRYADRLCSLTICGADRLPRFADASFADALVALLFQQARASRVTLHAYCLMPDHVHLLASPNGGDSVISFVQAFKGRSTRLAWEFGHAGTIWQPRFYDHFLREEEDIPRAVEYILNNPVRKGLVSNWHDYHWCGTSGDDA